MSDTAPAARGRVTEAIGLTLVVLVAIRLVKDNLSGVLWDLPLAIVPVLFMWAPVWWLGWRGEDPDRYPLAIPAFSDGAAWREAGRLAGLAALVTFPPFVLLYHLWHTAWLPWGLEVLCDAGLRDACRMARAVADEGPAWRFPAEPAKLVAYHLFFVAIPEELYYRGFVQSRLDEVWAPRWTILGARVGPGLLAASVIFALGHSVVAAQWWHPAIVVPSLVFGWMRARTGGVMAGAFFHAWSNVSVGFLDVAYGLQPP